MSMRRVPHQILVTRDDGHVRRARYIAHNIRDAYRNRGLTSEIADIDTAALLGVKRSRLRALVGGEAVRIVVAEYQNLVLRYLQHLEDEERSLQERIDTVRRRRQELENEQWLVGFVCLFCSLFSGFFATS